MRYGKLVFFMLMLSCTLLFSSCVFLDEDLFSLFEETSKPESEAHTSISCVSDETTLDKLDSNTHASEQIFQTDPTDPPDILTSEELSSHAQGSESSEAATPTDPSAGKSELAAAYERLMSANLPSRVLSENSNMLILHSSADKEGSWYYTLEEGRLSIDALSVNLQSEDTVTFNVRRGACYSLESGIPAVSFLSESDPDKVALLRGCTLFPSGACAVSTKTVDESTVELQASVVDRVTDKIARYTYLAESESLLLKSVLVEWRDGNGALCSERFDLSYGVADLVRDTTAYDLHEGAEDPVRLYLDTNADISVYTLASNTRVSASPNADGTEFALYKNDRKTKDVSDLSLQKNGELMLYLGAWHGDVSLEYTLNDADVEEYSRLIAELSAAMDGTDGDAVSALYDRVMSFYEYIQTQSNVAYVNYRLYGNAASYTSQYQEASLAYASAYSEMRAFLADVYISESSFKESVLSEWSQKELEGLLDDQAEIGELQEENERLLTEYNVLDTNDPNWSRRVDEIYEEIVQNSNQIASLRGYENYYEYATEYVRGRDYTNDERQAFRTYVKQYIVPLYFNASYAVLEAAFSLTETQAEAVEALLDDEISATEEEYLRTYFAEFSPSLSYKMSFMLDKNVLCIGSDSGAYEGAFTLYLPTYEEPVVYLGKGYTDLLTFVHENGHYAAYYGIGDGPLPDLDLCETHSQGNEWLFISYLENLLDPAVYEMFMLTRLVEGLKGIIISTLVDECEEAIYTAEIPYRAEQYDALIESIAAEYGTFGLYYDAVSYFKSVAPGAQVYYISYATSEMASVLLYAMAEENYDLALEAFSMLLDGADSTDRFLASMEACGFPSLFEEDTFLAFCELIERLLSLEAYSAAA